MSRKILIIEDDQTIAELERDFLEIENYEVTIIPDGKDTRETLRNNHYDLILLDIMLPSINGFELCKEIRQETDIPVLMVTAKHEDMDKVRGFGLGADDFIVKPFSPTELVARVKAHLARYERLVQHEKPPGVLHIGSLEINPSSRQVFVDGKEIPFTTKEFDLLQFMATHPNQVFSKEHLFEKIWGLDAMGDNSTVTVHIKKIRKKIEKDSTDPQYIRTVWGSGYRFNS
ncbi:DNA-binding response regulator, OmpR family, contains REC and winged-helix (wHTH) domain [Thalassobacillus cyri]|uniref:DNA-binding response regulator, OmpR family, contains REC and winged-helix (WHTH) domain n=1 Tax=Thalassobacillus cyri TaxID=571932 RepID=A0A1H3W1L2_9BACI|nr:response regulator transcription factor [Thalassobacillus cyri]SDZ80943.1 DNA-binding response regulator, OmpR family, contains REC and winged-helix (wHTH) domain [Thalassobacillus cyri]